VDSFMALNLIENLFQMQIDEKEFKKLTEYVKEFQINKDDSSKSPGLPLYSLNKI